MLRDLSTHSRGDDLARLVHTAAIAAADERRGSLGAGLAELAERLGIRFADAETHYGNVLRALDGSAARARPLLGALLARGIALSPPQGPAAEARLVETLAWLAAHAAVDAFPALDAALGEHADGLWRASAALVRRDGGNAGRAGALVAAAHLRGSRSSAASGEAASLSGDVRDPVVRALLASPAQVAAVGAASLSGELKPAPRGPVALLLMGITGILAVYHLGRLIARFLLRYRAPAEVRISEGGVTVISRTELLGRTLRERELHIPAGALMRATREVRFPALPTYVGLIALALGSYFGLRLFADGARAGSPEFLAMGALAVLLGVALDFALESLTAGARGRCRIVLLPRRGNTICIGELDRASADAALSRLRQS
jgi:hypothetical protein